MKKFALTAVLTLALMPSAQASTRLVTAPKCEEPVPTRSYEKSTMTYGVSIDLRGCPWWDGSPINLVASLSRLAGTGEEGTSTATICGGWPAKHDDAKNGTDDGHGRDGDLNEPGDEDTVDNADGNDNDADSDEARGGRHKRENADEEATGDDNEGNDAHGFEAASASDDRFTCDVTTALEHPSAELALYRGEVTYPWKDGPKTVGFSAYCASPGGLCRDGQ
jgi:hypothetical protein